MFIVDAHQDLAYNAIRYNRDLRLPLSALREHERTHPAEGIPTVTIPNLLEGRIGLLFSTLFSMPLQRNFFMPENRRLVYETADQAYQVALEQLDYYQRLADEIDQIRLVRTRAELEEVVASHDGRSDPLLGIVLLMEGADPVRDPAELEEWYDRGVRLIGPAWDDTRYAGGAWQEGGGFTREGFALLETMAALGFILDITHLSDKAAYEVLDRYQGHIVATHSNARALVPGMRHISDDLIRRLAERDGVTGVVIMNRFIKSGLSRTDPKEAVTIADLVAHIDHVCQLLGSAAHVGIGSDLDGGFGRDDIPAEMDNAADLHKLIPALAERGYGDDDVAAIMGGNWLRKLRSAWEDGG
jgi:membrane dipeptidase